MTQRLDARFAKLRTEGRAGLVTFTMAFDPDRTTAQALLDGLPAAGADVIELGIPFSDPVADGPVIQESGLRALEAGATLKGVLEMVATFRKQDKDTPVILMGYYNPIFHYGEGFAADAVAAGVDGVIIVDLPPEELGELQPAADAQGLALVRLAAPTTGDARLAVMLQGARGFVYYIAVAGITGQRSADLDALEQRVRHLKSLTGDLPLAVGFGVKSPEQAARIGGFADAVVVGSALVASLHTRGVADTLGLVRELATALQSGNNSQKRNIG